MLVARYQTKKDLKAAKGKNLKYAETNLYGLEYKPNGVLYMVGPDAYERKWYAQVTMKNGLIEKVM
jgi:hypothetical protein